MITASKLPQRYGIGKTYFYKRRDYLRKLGYNLEPLKQGRKSFYTDEQVQLLDSLDAHIKTHGGMDGFRQAAIEVSHLREDPNPKASPTNNGNGLVHTHRSPIEIESADPEEIVVDTNPLEDIKEQQLESLHVAAQYNAATNLTALNYLTLDYMKHRDFTVAGLSEQVHQSEQAVRESFTSMMVSPEQATKKLMSRLLRRRQR